MWLCDYTNDLGIKYRRIKPTIIGVNKNTGEGIAVGEVLLIVSNYIAIDGYYEVGNREAVCSLIGRKRRLKLEIGGRYYELDYYKPFTEIDWQLLEGEGIACETLPEYIKDADLKLNMRGK